MGRSNVVNDFSMCLYTDTFRLREKKGAYLGITNAQDKIR